MNIYVGNLANKATEEDLKKAFSAFGEIATVSIIKDKFSGESKGFGFVEMPSKEDAEKAIEGMNGQDLLGRALNVNEARPKTEHRSGGFGGGRGGDRGGRGGGDRGGRSGGDRGGSRGGGDRGGSRGGGGGGGGRY